ncbi:YdaU family protein [Sphingobacterium sp. SGG-5]|uniref:YdaU family protein n=1 Tax=Sphingobacterium sp. SGG-5 TaxID=2710881 RepID=UPI0013EBBBA9|nr:YdaU family protein [Sphingobacterium sp. SGG-5]NGM63546.1 YdaU family protein [Sphingobacterium sp. SGG-5]
MSRKLGYTWYPKDFISDPDVMFMTAAERGVYRDLLDIAYLNDNEIKYNVEMLAKYTNSDIETVQRVLNVKGKEIDVGWSIPSCEKRLNIAQKNKQNGGKGGRPKTQTKPKSNPNNNQSVTNTGTQTERQREREIESEYKREIESESELPNSPTQNFSFPGRQPIETLKKNCAGHQSWLESIGMKNSLSMGQVLEWFDAFCLHLLASGKTEETEQEFKRYCASWIASEVRQGRKPITTPPPEVNDKKLSAMEIAKKVAEEKYGNINI